MSSIYGLVLAPARNGFQFLYSRLIPARPETGQRDKTKVFSFKSLRRRSIIIFFLLMSYRISLFFEIPFFGIS
jgi:hypothetical protein